MTLKNRLKKERFVRDEQNIGEKIYHLPFIIITYPMRSYHDIIYVFKYLRFHQHIMINYFSLSNGISKTG